MDNKELTDAANGLVQWANSQEIRPADLEKVMMKLMAKILLDRLGVKKIGDPTPSHDAWQQAILKSQEDLLHEIITRIYKLAGRTP